MHTLYAVIPLAITPRQKGMLLIFAALSMALMGLFLVGLIFNAWRRHIRRLQKPPAARRRAPQASIWWISGIRLLRRLDRNTPDDESEDRPS